MPEGPSLVILKDEVAQFRGKKIISVCGNSSQDIARMEGQKIIDFKTWGKHFLICFKDFTVRIHFLMFGRYAINDTRPSIVRVGMKFSKGEFNLYNCSVQFIEEPLDAVYEWTADVMNDGWDEKAAKKKLKAQPDMLVVDALLDQTIFAGVGNIIKNEVLFRIMVHPETTIGGLPARKLTELVKQARIYSFEFLEWKKAYVLKKNWKAHTKRTCAECAGPLTKVHLGKTNRRTFYCAHCQVKYESAPAAAQNQ